MAKLLQTNLPFAQGENVSSATFNQLVRVLEINLGSVDPDNTLQLTTAERDTLNFNIGQIIYNTSTTTLQYWDGSTFQNISSTGAVTLNITDGSSNIAIDLFSETLSLLGGTGITSTASGNGVTFAIDSTVATLVGSQTLTNKTIDVDNNTLSNIEVDNFKASAIVTESEGISSNDNDTTLPTSAAVKDFVDSQVDTVDTLSEILAVGNTTGGTDIAVSANDDITFTDSSKAIFGAGSDLKIYHDGSNSFIQDSGTGNLRIAGTQVDILNPDANEFKARFKTDGAVELYHDNVKKFQTNASGIEVIGSATFDNSISIEHSSGFGSIEVGGSSGAFIDLKNPMSDDYDLRLKTTGTGGEIDVLNGELTIKRGSAARITTSASGIDITGSATISGDLTVSGTTTTINTTNLEVKDKNITLNFGAGDTSSNANGAGITIQDAVSASTDATILWDSTNDEFDFSHGINISGSSNFNNALTIQGTTTFNDDAIFVNDALFGDNDKAIFGAGSDLQIFHDGSNSFVKDAGTGFLSLITNGSDIRLVGNAGSDFMARFNSNGSVQLYHDNSKKFETTLTGATVTGFLIATTAVITDSIFPNTSNAAFSIKNSSEGTIATFNNDLSTSFLGDILLGDNKAVKVGTGSDLQLFHNGSSSVIRNDTGHLDIKNGANDADIRFMCDDGSGGETSYFILDGSQAQSRFLRNVQFDDSIKAKFGSAGDLEIYHDGSASYIDDTGTGQLILNTNGSQIALKFGSENMAVFTVNDAVKLYYDSSKKFETTSSGISVTGSISSGNITTSGSSPTYTLQDSDGTNQLSTLAQDGGSFILTARNNTSNGNIIFKGNNGSSVSEYGRFNSSGNFSSEGNVTVGSALKMGSTTVIDSSRNLTNIGTIACSGNINATGGNSHTFFSGGSSGQLQVGRGSNQEIQIFVDDTNNKITAFQDSDSNGTHRFILDREFDGTGANSFHIRKEGTDQLSLDTNGTLTVPGNVEFFDETADAHHSLTLQKRFNKETAIKWARGSDVDAQIRVGDGENLFIDYNHSNTGDSVIFRNNSSEVARIDNSGRLGIGTNAPTRALDINGSGTSILANFENTGGTTSFISFGNTSSTADQIRVGSSGTALVLSTNYTERLRIDTSGLVGIGTTSPSRPLHVKNSDNVVAFFESTDANSFIHIKDTVSGLSIGSDSSGHGVFSADIDQVGNKNILFKNAGATKATLNTGGSLDTLAGFSIGTTQVIDSSRNIVNIGTVSSGAITANTGASAAIPLIIGSGSSTNYTLQRWITSAHSGNSAYILAYGASHSSQAGNFAMKNVVSGGEIFFELASNVEPLRLTSTGATFASNITLGASGAIDTASGNIIFKSAGSTVAQFISSPQTAFSMQGAFVATGFYNTTLGGYQINGTTVIDNSRNLTNIGTISSGSITSSGDFIGDTFGTSTNKITWSIANNARIFTNGSERLRIDSSGNLGLGTTSPANGLEISFANPKIRIRESDVTNGFGDILYNSTRIRIRSRNDSSNGAISFEGQAGSTVTEYARFTSSGAFNMGPTSGTVNVITAARNLVNINTISSGTITSSGNIDVNSDSGQLQFGADNDMQMFHNGAKGEINIATGNFDIDSAGEITLDADTSGVIRLKDGGTEFGKISQNSNNLRIFSSISDGDILLQGNDGGSTITALQLDMSAGGNATFAGSVTATSLSVSSAFSTTANINISGTSGKYQINSLDVIEYSGGFRVGSVSDDDESLTLVGFGGQPNIVLDDSVIKFGYSTNEKMRLDSSGRLGIGTTSPNFLLDVEGTGSTLARLNSTSGAAVFQISVPDTSSICDINFGDSANSSRGQIRYRHTGDSLALSTAGSEALRIDSSQRVGIGTTVPGQALDVRSAANIQLKLASTTSSNNSRMVFAPNNTEFWNIGTNISNGDFTFFDVVNSVTPVRFEAGAGTNTLVVDSNSRVGIGTNAPSENLHVVGNILTSGGVKVGDSSADALHFHGILKQGSGSGTTVMDSSRNLTNIGTITSTGRHLIQSGNLQMNNGNNSHRYYYVSTGSGGGDFLLGQIELNDEADGAIEGTVCFAYDYGTTSESPKIHFSFAQRNGTARGKWWYEHDDDAAGSNNVKVVLIDDGSGGMFVWLRVSDFAKLSLNVITRQGGNWISSGQLSSGTITTGTTLFDTSNDPTSEHHIGALFAHANSTFSGTISSGAITSSASITASGNSNNFGNTTIAALSATSGTFSASITASGNSNSFGNSSFGTINSGAITTSGELLIARATPSIHFFDSDDSSDGYIQANAGTLAFFADDNNEVSNSIINFSIDGSEKMRLDNAGSLAIGNTSPSSFWSQANKLVLDASGNTGMTIKSTSSGNGRIVFTDQSSSNPGLNDGGQIHYGHSADDMKFRTAGADRVTINATGVGIGTTSPIANLQVGDGTGSETLLLLGSNSNTTSSQILFGDNTSGADPFEFGMGIRYDSSNNVLHFDDNFNDSGSANNPIMSIDRDDQRVGIGTTSPDTLLELSKAAGTGTSLAKLANTSSAATSNIAQIDFELSNSFSGANVDVQIGAIKTNAGNEESAFYVKTTSGTGTPTERLRIDASGKVGINTTSPDFELDVAGDIGMDNKLYHNGDHNTFIGFTADTQTFRTGGTDRVTINNTGVGITVTSPTSKLNIDTESDQGIAIFRTGTNANFDAIQFRKSNNSDLNSRIGFNENQLRLDGTNDILFGTGGSYTERMRINASGRVGIGTDSPSLALEINDTSNVDGEQISIKGSASYGGTVVFRRGDSFNWRVGVGGGSSTNSTIPSSFFGIEQGNTANFVIAHTTGSVGINTTDPGGQGYSFAEDLVVRGGASADDGVGITLRGNGKRYGVIAFGDNADPNSGEIFYDHTDNKLSFRTNDNVAFNVDSAGKIQATNGIAANAGSGINQFHSAHATSNADDWQISPISIRERGLVGSAQSANSYSPNINFHWASRVARSLTMLADGSFVLGEWTASGAPETTANLSPLNTGGYRINGTDVITSSRNIQQVGTITLGANGVIDTASGHIIFKSGGGTKAQFTAFGLTLQGAYSSTGSFNTSLGGYQINGTNVIDSSRNLTNIGTYAGSGDITLTSGSNQVLLAVTNGALEITRSAGGPFIDFKNSTSDDFDSRIMGGNALIFSTGGNGSTATALTLGSNQSATFAGVISGVGGNASAPSYIFEGNTDTGFFHPATDAIGFSTAGSERMRLDNSGRLGVGTSSPSEKLTVAGNITASGSGDKIISAISSDDDGTLFLSGAGSGKDTHIVFGNDRDLFISKSSSTTATSEGTPVLTLGSNSNATFAGNISLAQQKRINLGGLAFARMNASGNFELGDVDDDDREVRINAFAGTSRIDMGDGSVAITGALSKSSGSFKIDHPLKPDTHDLVHSFVEGPQADNLYRGTIKLEEGKATIDLDEWFGMTPGTFLALNRDIQAFVSNVDDWDAVRAKIMGSQLIIECQNTASKACVSWLVVGERQDKEIYASKLTDDNGKIIVEPLKEVVE